MDNSIHNLFENHEDLAFPDNLSLSYTLKVWVVIYWMGKVGLKVTDKNKSHEINWEEHCYKIQ